MNYCEFEVVAVLAVRWGRDCWQNEGLAHLKRLLSKFLLWCLLWCKQRNCTQKELYRDHQIFLSFYLGLKHLSWC